MIEQSRDVFGYDDVAPQSVQETPLKLLFISHQNDLSKIIHISISNDKFSITFKISCSIVFADHRVKMWWKGLVVCLMLPAILTLQVGVCNKKNKTHTGQITGMPCMYVCTCMYT